MRCALTGERKRGFTLENHAGSVRSSDMPTMTRVMPM